jgi:hypothetical protein
MTRTLLTALFAALLVLPAAAESRYASPPGEGAYPPEHYPSADYAPEREPYVSESPLRVSVGPALRFNDQALHGGLATSVDFGARAAGARLSALWVRAGGDQGLSQYGAELWVDFGGGGQLRPIVGAGAALARLDSIDEAGDRSSYNLGVGVLRATLEYVLPLSEAHARAGVDLIGNVPAIRSLDAPEALPWALLVGRVGVGF